MSTLVDLLRQRAEDAPERRVYTFLEDDGETETAITYGELLRRARDIAGALQAHAAPGERVVLLYPPGLEYVAGFLGCLHAGLVAVPAYPPDPTRLDRTLPRLRAMIEDARASVVITTSFILSMAEFIFEQAPDLKALRWIATDEVPPGAGGELRIPELGADSLAFLQYTSGSTGTPKGVMLTHGNLLHNLQLIHGAFRMRGDSVGVIWLPPYHDMGLIGGLLGTIYGGFSTSLMSPLTFLRYPLRWLQLISRTGATISGGPNFAFDLCVRKTTEEDRAKLDLSRWEVAFCGAEPIRPETLARFVRAFGPCGFRRESFYPCYGLAEGTLIVSGGDAGAEPVLRALDPEELRRGRAVPSAGEAARMLVGCGRTLEVQEIAVVHPETLARCAPGQVGEIWVNGPSVAKGYWGRTEESAQIFQARMSDGSGPFLRTGDQGFLDEGGQLFVTGRLKDLIIIRGRNHHPQDIELTAEQASPALRPGCGAAFSVEVEGEERLVLVYELDTRRQPVASAEEIARAVGQRAAETHELQLYALTLIEPGSLPKTSSGKIQRRATRAAWLAGELQQVTAWRSQSEAAAPVAATPEVAPALPQGPLTREDLAAWLRATLARRLHVAPAELELREPLTRYGLDSLAAVELSHDLEKGLGVGLPMEALLSGPSIEDLADRLLALKAGAAARRAPPIEHRAPAAAEPLSFAQQRMWFLHQLAPGEAHYHIAATVRLIGQMDAAALERSFAEVARRHASLRTTFRAEAGQPLQEIHPEARLEPRRMDLSALPAPEREAQARRLAEEEARRPFDLARGPLLRTTLVKLSETEHVLVLCMHHIVSDGGSMAALVRELSQLYAALTQGQPSPLPDLPVQYTDYARWQREALQGDALGPQLDYWKRQLAGAPQVLELPTDKPRPPVQSLRGASCPVRLPRESWQKLQAVARAEGVTPFMLLLATFEVLLHRYSGQEELCVGTPVAGRDRPELSDLIGFFVNTLVLRADLAGNPTFRELLGQVRQRALEAYANQDVPFEKLVEELRPERDTSRSPLFQAVLALLPDPLPGARLPGLELRSEELESRTARFDLELSLTESDAGLNGALIYCADLFEPETAARMVRHLTGLLEALAARPEQRIGDVPLLTAAERHQVLVDFNPPPTAFPAEACIHHLFERQATLRPDAVALEFGAARLTYRQLDERANQLAHLLRAHGVGPDCLVGLCLERSLELVVSLLAILKAGGAYLPLESSYPAQRLAFMLEDAQPRLLLTTRALRSQLNLSAPLPTLFVEELALGDQPTSAPASGVTSRHLAYVDFTSGSTGRPKGVAIEHRAVLRLLHGAEYIHLGPEETFVLTAPISFDASTLELWAPLLFGSRLVVFPPESPSDLKLLGQVLKHHRVTTLWLTAGLLTQVVDLEPDCLQPLRQLLTGGDVVSAPHARRVLEQFGIPVTNGYGPTESTVFTACFRAVRPEQVGATMPIGKPIANTQVYLLDSGLQPVPVGVPGELFIGGEGLARGYLSQPRLTAERFIPNPFSSTPGARLYRTGDLARWRADGTIEFLGRKDSQVKVRGFRIELSEVEAALRAHPAVREAVAVVREDSPGDKRLVAYAVLHPAPEAPDSEALRAFVAQRLPGFMVPSAIVALEALPLTANAKVDRKALPAPELSLGERYTPPATPTEERLAALWAEVLRAPRVGRSDNFFSLGGHSLLATQLMSRVREDLRVDLPLRALFEAPTVSAFASRIDAALAAGLDAAAPPIIPVPRTGPLPLSFAQQRLWFLDQLEPGSPLYNIPAVVQLDGALDASALQRSFAALVERHEPFRTTFSASDGKPVQVISPPSPLPLPVTALDHLPEPAREQEARRLCAEEALRPFDLASGTLLRASLLRLAPQRHLLLLTMHHIVSDGWSMGVLIRELAALYGAFASGHPSSLSPLPLQYADFAAWQRGWLQGSALDQQLSWWRQQLLDAPSSLDLPTDRPRPPVQTYRGASLPFALSRDLSSSVKAFAQQHGVTPFMVLLSAFQALLHRYSGQLDLCVGAPIANRTRAETEGLIGFFVNTLVLRARLSPETPFLELLSQARDTTLGAFQHQDVPFERLVEELQPSRALGRSPLFQVAFALQNAPMPPLGLPGVSAKLLDPVSAIAKFELTLALFELDAGYSGYLEYSTDLFDAPTVERMARHLRTLLAAALEAPGRRIGDLPLMTAAEQRQVLVEWNATATDFPRDACVHHLFEDQARRTPNATAVEYDGQALTYAELDARADRLAHHLRSLGVTPGAVVGLCAQRSPDLIVAMLGVLKAGAAYLPLDPAHPAERLAFMVQDASVRLVLAHAALASLFPASTPVVLLDSLASLASASARATSAPLPALAPACVIYTSGSTGRPKGVCIPHRAVVRLFLQANYLELLPSDRLAQTSNTSFDAATFEIWGPLLTGGCLVGAPLDVLLSPQALSAWIREQRVSVLFLTTALLNQLSAAAPEAFQPLRRLLFGGEAADARSVRRVLEHFTAPRRLLHLYGPTESTTYATWHPVAEVAPSATTVPIGKPVSNTTFYVLDSRLRPVPPGVAGELFIGGDGLALGYLNRPEQTAERFIPHPFSSTPGERLYRTGDVVRLLEDGSLVFVGRTDFQVKIRGFRIELGEIEEALRLHPDARDVLVLVREDAPGDKRLVAYVSPREGHSLSAQALREHLARRLPPYMVPSAFVLLDAFPLNANGKVDRKALPAPNGSAADGGREHVEPTSELEREVAAIWRELLKVERVSLHDDFFALGGHSLLATQLISRVRTAFEIDLPLKSLFDNPTLHNLTVQIVQAQARQLDTGDLEALLAAVETQATGAARPRGTPEDLETTDE